MTDIGDDVKTPFKLATMVDTMSWNDESDLLVAIADGKLITWYNPHVVQVDQTLLNRSKDEQEGVLFGKHSSIISFFGSHLKLRRADGALMTASVRLTQSSLTNLSRKGNGRKQFDCVVS